MAKLIQGVNDLVTTHPDLVKEWHPTLNGDLKPEMFTEGSGQIIVWLQSYDDPTTGKHHDFVWKTSIKNRAVNGSGNPYLPTCTNPKVWKGYNDLATIHPELAVQWHPTKNGNLTPEMVTAGSHKKVWWYLPYDDSKTGKHFNFEWEAIILSRVYGCGCPYLSGKAVWKGFNDLATTNPELVAEWHPTLNGDKTPDMYSAGSTQKIWWLVYAKHPVTGESVPLSWKSTITNRTCLNRGCPYISNPARAILVGFNDLATTNPKLASEWHPTKNGNLTPEMVTAGSNKKIWWTKHFVDPKTGKEWDFDWKTSISNRAKGKNDCPYLSGKAVQKGFNDLATTYPDLVKDWHLTLNGNLKPDMVTTGSEKKVWWKGKCGHEWKAIICNRVKGRGCPICAKEAKTSFPEQAIYFYIKKYFPDALNGDKKALGGKELDVYIPSLNLGIEYDGEYRHKDAKKDDFKNQLCKEKGISLIRIRDNKCPELTDTYSKNYLYKYNSYDFGSLSEVISEFLSDLLKEDITVDVEADKLDIYDLFITTKKENSVAVKYPEIAKEWHPTKNGNLTPDMFLYNSGKRFWWKCACGHEWQTRIYKRTVSGTGCPSCKRR